MKTIKRPVFTAAALLFALGAAFARAQEEPAAPPSPDMRSAEPGPTAAAAGLPAAPEYPGAPPENSPAYEPTSRAPTSVFAPEAAPAGEAPAQLLPPPSLMQWGSVALQPHPAYSLFYTTGILAAPGQTVSTTRQSFSPGFLIQAGPNWSLDYTPTWEEYSNRLFHDGFDQAAKLLGRAAAGDWNFNFSQGFASTNDPLIETGRQTREDAYDTNFRAVYDFAGHTLLELSADQDIQLSPTSPDAYDWSTLDWLHHPISPRLDVAIGGGFAYIAMDPGFDMTALRPEGRITWRTTDKLSVDAQGGWEHRIFVGSGGRTLDTPIYTVTAAYQATDTTVLTATANRDVQPGYSVDQVDDVTNLSLGLQQRLLGHFFLGAQAGRERIEYLMIGGLPAGARGDDATSAQISLNTVLFRRLSLGIQYSRVRDDSNVPGFNFDSNQYGLTAQFRY